MARSGRRRRTTRLGLGKLKITTTQSLTPHHGGVVKRPEKGQENGQVKVYKWEF